MGGRGVRWPRSNGSSHHTGIGCNERYLVRIRKNLRQEEKGVIVMGCDIHGYVEYERRYLKGYSPWTSQQLSLPRSYTWFALLAGVRDEHGIQMFAPRGIPEDSCPEIRLFRYGLAVVPDDDFEAPYDDEIRYVPESSYQQWKNHSEELGTYGGDLRFVKEPDWHTPSWLNTEEVRLTVNAYQAMKSRDGYEVAPEIKALLAAMEQLPKARFVFWFDN